MKQVTALTDEQIREYKEQGCIVLPSVFSRKEINVLEKTSYDVLKRPGPEVAREADGTPMFAGEWIFLTSVLKY